MTSLNACVTSRNRHDGTSAEQLLDVACNGAGVLGKTVSRFGDTPLQEYMGRLARVSPLPHQPRDDLIDLIYHYVAPLLGETAAERTAQSLQELPSVLTANHHGVDYFSQSVQGTLLFSLYRQGSKKSAAAVPILSCGNIPMNNLTYPLGMLFYGLSEGLLENSPKKLPIFADRHKRTMVNTAPGLDRVMVDRAMQRIGTMSKNGEMHPRLAACAQGILREDYSDPQVLQLQSYSDQAVVLNHRIWKRLFADSGVSPEVVVVELEKIVSKLLERDLSNPESLAWRVLFDRNLRGHVLEELEGQRICWRRDNLVRRLQAACGVGGEQVLSNGCGTLFFWGVDEAGRKIPLTLDEGSNGTEMLRGVDDRGEVREHAFTPASLISGLKDHKLIPSLFTCYLAVSLARNVICLGGYYQAEYLPAIQRGLLRGLRRTSAYHAMAGAILGVPTNGYLSGMQTVMTEVGNGRLVPSGPLEIIAHGGLTDEDLERVRSLTVREAHMASLSETVSDLSPVSSSPTAWKTQLAADCYRLLADRIVIK